MEIHDIREMVGKINENYKGETWFMERNTQVYGGEEVSWLQV